MGHAARVVRTPLPVIKLCGAVPTIVSGAPRGGTVGQAETMLSQSNMLLVSRFDLSLSGYKGSELCYNSMASAARAFCVHRGREERVARNGADSKIFNARGKIRTPLFVFLFLKL